MIKLIVLGALVLAAVVAYRLWKKGKAVTAGSVAAGAESVVKTAVADVKSDVTKSL